MCKKKKIAVFDFDGTITTKDTLLEFIKFACGYKKFYLGFFLYSPILVLMKLRLFPNWRAKQLIFSFFFGGWSYLKFSEYGKRFSDKIDAILNDKMIQKLYAHMEQGDKVYIVSASVEEWIKPWCEKNDISNVLSTKINIDNSGNLTGDFYSKNCYGTEKVNRFLEKEPNRNEYYLYAYGDSRGDKEMLAFADEGYMI